MKTTFNKLKDGEWFTFRKNGELTGKFDDELCRLDNEFNGESYNVMDHGGAWYKINNGRAIVHTL